MRLPAVLILSFACGLLIAAPRLASAELIENGLGVGAVGYWGMEMQDAGESFSGSFTAHEISPAGTINTDVIFKYATFINIGGGGVRLSTKVDTPVAYTDLTHTKTFSAGHFDGSAGNRIDWNVESSIAPGSPVMTNKFTFTAVTGTLGNLQLTQYLDEDVKSKDDDVFFVRGSAAAGNLELYTVDNLQAFGVSQSGAQTAAQGLVNASLLGFAADSFDEMEPAIIAGTQAVSLTGVIDSVDLPPFFHSLFGAAHGPNDVVGMITWAVNASGTTATIITTIGGVPSASDVTSVPEPAAVLLGCLALAGFLSFARHFRRAV